MNIAETFQPENTTHLHNAAERQRHLEDVAQIAWFEHRAQMLDGADAQKRLQRLASASPEQGTRIAEATPAILQDVIMEDLVLSESEEGSTERRWFRESFLPSEEAAELLGKFQTDTEAVLAEMDRLFATTQH